MTSSPTAAQAVTARPPWYCIILLVCLLTLLGSCGTAPSTAASPSPVARDTETLTQVSTYPALQMGEFDGDTTYGELAQDGDFGLGTFDGLDGEMIALDGVFYQAKSDGSVAVVDKTMKVPFADVHFFQSTQQIQISAPLQTVDQLTAYLTKQLPSVNRPYAFKISGTFPSITFRSVPKQSKPYVALKDAVAQQKEFEERDINGTLVGYMLPAYLSGIGVTGYHFHFISADKHHGGHLLAISITQASVDIDYLESVKLIIPQNETFQQTNFAKP